MGQGLLDDHERFKNLTAGIQSLVIALGVLVGGLWAVYAFNAQRVAEIARMEAQARAEALVKEVDIVPEISVSSVQETQGEHVVFGTLRITNRGTKAVDVPLKEAMEIAHAAPPYDAAGEYRPLGFVRLYCGVGKSMRSQTVPAKATESFPFCIPVRARGVYMLSYVAAPSADDMGMRGKAREQGASGGDAWHAVSFFLVP